MRNDNISHPVAGMGELGALAVAMHFYDALVTDPVTAPAAFGVACYELREILNLSLPAAALIVQGELDRRELKMRKAIQIREPAPAPEEANKT